MATPIDAIARLVERKGDRRQNNRFLWQENATGLRPQGKAHVLSPMFRTVGRSGRYPARRWNRIGPRQVDEKGRATIARTRSDNYEN
jgi:hypothetical protein